MVCITLAIFFLLQKPKGTAKSLQAVATFSCFPLKLCKGSDAAAIPSFAKRLLRKEDSPFGTAVSDKSLHLSSLPRLHKAPLDASLQVQQRSIWVGIRPPSHLHTLPLNLSAGLEDQRKTPPLPSSILLGKKYFCCIKACVYSYIYRNLSVSGNPESRAAIVGLTASLCSPSGAGSRLPLQTCSQVEVAP